MTSAKGNVPEREIYQTKLEVINIKSDRVIFRKKNVSFLDEKFSPICSDIEMTICQDYHTMTFQIETDLGKEDIAFSWGQLAPRELFNPTTASYYAGVRTSAIRELVNLGFFVGTKELVTPIDASIKKVGDDAYEVMPLYADSSVVVNPYTINGNRGNPVHGKWGAEEYVTRLISGEYWKHLVDSDVADTFAKQEEINNVKKKEHEDKIIKSQDEADKEAYRTFMEGIRASINK